MIATWQTWRRLSLPLKLASLFLVVYGLLSLVPVLWVFSLSLRAGREVFTTLFVPSSLHPENYLVAWERFGFATLFRNSILVTAASVLLTLAVASLAAYAFARLRFRGADVVFFALLLGVMVPPAAAIVPLFVMFKGLAVFNNQGALVATYVAFGLPIAVLILRGFFLTIPAELVEAAKIDGCSELGAFWRIVLPLSRPALATVTIFLCMSNWNEFLLALVFLRDTELYTLPVGIAQFVGQWDSPWELVAAGVIIAALPIWLLYLGLQEQFVKGLTAGALKG